MESEPGDDASQPGGEKPARRPRYSGKHPQRFDQKYKEHDPARFPGVVQRVLESGKTPAGSHRPICVDEILGILAPAPGETAVDATLGHAGHALALLPRLQPGGRLIGIDADPLELPRAEALVREAGYGPEAFVAACSNMAGLAGVLSALGLERAHVVVADLGCSSMQLDDPARGFSYKREGPLDLRMNPHKGLPAAALLAEMGEANLAALLLENADETRASQLAGAIVRARCRRPIASTSDLAGVVRAVLPRSADEAATLARVFQALRIEVNGELSSLEAFLRVLPSCLHPGGRVAILTFHSGEDRRVKHAFQEGWREGVYCEAARDVIRPAPAEMRANPRASSAKLRWAVRAP